MASFDDGIKEYIHAQATVDVFFPVNHRGEPDISCNQCFFFRRSYQTCGLNGEVCQYPTKFVGGFCPLTPVNEEENDATDQ